MADQFSISVINSLLAMKYVFLSPHFDDAVFSCGGLIWELNQRGADVEVWTICAGEPDSANLSPFAMQLHQRWGSVENAVEIRMAEEEIAAQILNYKIRKFPIADCIYRHNQDGTYFYTTESSLFGNLHPQEDALIESLSKELKKIIGADTRVVSPLGVGNHVDHQLTRKAIEAGGFALWYYAEVPYILKDRDWQAKWLVNRNLIFRIPISEEGLQAWVQAAAVYASQISTFWASEQLLREDLHQLVKQGLGGILWG